MSLRRYGCEPLPTTPRLTFRWWRRSDLDLAKGLWGDPRVTERIDARTPLSEGQVEGLLERQLEMADRVGLQYWPVFRSEDGEHVGCCGLRPYDPESGVLELGVQLRAKHWGDGFATEAARAVIELAFERLQVPALFAGHHPDNVASRALLGKLGFRYIHDEPYAPTGLDHPSYLLVAEEHSGRSTAG